MKPRTALLATIASVVVLGCSTQPVRETASGGAKGAPRSTQAISAYFVGSAAPLSSTTDLCVAYLCAVEIKVDAACNVSSTAVLSLGAVGPYPRKIMFVISDSDSSQPHIFPPANNNPPPLVVNKSGSNDPAFGTPLIPQPYNVMWVLFNNSAGSPHVSHEYGINVKNANTGVMCPTYDPWVIE